MEDIRAILRDKSGVLAVDPKPSEDAVIALAKKLAASPLDRISDPVTARLYFEAHARRRLTLALQQLARR